MHKYIQWGWLFVTTAPKTGLPTSTGKSTDLEVFCKWLYAQFDNLNLVILCSELLQLVPFFGAVATLIELEHTMLLHAESFAVVPQENFVRVQVLTKHFNIKSNGSHEEVDIAEPLA